MATNFYRFMSLIQEKMSIKNAVLDGAFSFLICLRRIFRFYVCYEFFLTFL